MHTNVSKENREAKILVEAQVQYHLLRIKLGLFILFTTFNPKIKSIFFQKMLLECFMVLKHPICVSGNIQKNVPAQKSLLRCSTSSWCHRQHPCFKEEKMKMGVAQLDSSFRAAASSRQKVIFQVTLTIQTPSRHSPVLPLPSSPHLGTSQLAERCCCGFAQHLPRTLTLRVTSMCLLMAYS